MRVFISLFFAFTLSLATVASVAGPPREFNVRDFGAVGDGVALDTAAINRAIEAAAAARGGTVRFPAGVYLSFSVRLKSNITLYLENGAVLRAATPSPGFGAYDPPEPNESGEKSQYQDFGHSHWHNSLIWGEELENIVIAGAGLIDGKALVRNAGDHRRDGPNGTPTSATGSPMGENGASLPGNVIGVGDKAIGLKNCRNVIIRDLSLRLCGHFAVLATGVDQLTLANLTVDTNRDGFDLDACRDVVVRDCRVNTPNDDAIVLKSSLALGKIRDIEDVRVVGCTVSGYDVGTLLDGTRRQTMIHAPDRDGPTGRIKLGTESSGGFKRIMIADCTFEHSRGLAIETVDGGAIEDVTVRNLTMRDIVSSPIFIRLGNRGRSPTGTPVGSIRHVTISDVTVTNADARYASIIAGLPGHRVEEISLKNIRIEYKGGLTLAQVARQPAELINPFFLRGPGLTGPRDAFSPPEQEKGYPEPSMFGLLPAYGFFIRHAAAITVEDVAVSFTSADDRPPVVLQNVSGIKFERFKAQRADGIATFVLKDVTDFATKACPGVADIEKARVVAGSF